MNVRNIETTGPIVCLFMSNVRYEHCRVLCAQYHGITIKFLSYFSPHPSISPTHVVKYIATVLHISLLKSASFLTCSECIQLIYITQFRASTNSRELSLLWSGSDCCLLKTPGLARRLNRTIGRFGSSFLQCCGSCAARCIQC